MLNTLNVNLNTDLKVTRVPELGIKIKSQDINNNLFILRFTDKGKAIELDETYTVEILTKFEKSKSHRLTSATVYRDYARWEFDTSFITQDEKVTNYVYVRKAGSLVVSADANAFAFDVGLSEIDKDAGRVAEVYDENYQKYLDEFKDNVDFEEIAQAEQARKEAELLREENYNQKVDTAIVEADVVEKVDNKVTELTPKITELTAQLAQNMTQLNGVGRVLTQTDFNTKNLKLSGTFIINSSINLSDITISGTATIAQTATIYINNNVRIDTGITFDLKGAYGESLVLQGRNIDIMKNAFKNAYSTTFSRFIYIKDICENVHVSQNLFSGMSAFQNGVTGDSDGTVRAIQSQNAKNLIIEDNTFEGIEGTEDSDYIAILSNGSQTINGKSYFNHGDIKIRNNRFKNPQKCAVKVQCSGVEIVNNFIESDGLVFTRMLFRLYNACDVKVNDNYTNKGILLENALQLDTVLNGQFNNNKIQINKKTDFTGSLFFIMDVNSNNLSISNNEVRGDDNGTVFYSKFTGSSDVTYSKNTFDSHSLELGNTTNFTAKLNTHLKTMFAFVDFLANTTNTNVRFEQNTMKEVSRLVNVRNSGNIEIYFIYNLILNYPSGFNAFSFFIADQDKQQFKVIDESTKNLSYGISLDRPIIFKHIGYRYFDTTLNKMIMWNGTEWKDGTGTTV